MNDAIYKLIKQCLPGFGRDLHDDILTCGTVKTLKKQEFVIRQGQFARYLPIVIEGTVKVYSEEDDIQFLLYYIYPGETCIFSFAHLFGEKEVTFSGVAEEDTLLLLLPIHKAKEWLLKYPAFSEMILHEYQKHYNDLLLTTKQIICYSLEERVLNYLNTRSDILGTKLLPVSHQHIADDLATSREVVSRILKKLEKDKKILQNGRKIQLL